MLTINELIDKKNNWFSKYNCQLFGLAKKNINSTKSFIGSINTVFANYGLKITIQKYSKRCSAKITSFLFYTLKIDANFMELII